MKRVGSNPLSSFIYLEKCFYDTRVELCPDVSGKFCKCILVGLCLFVHALVHHGAIRVGDGEDPCPKWYRLSG